LPEGTLALIEWPERAGDALPHDRIDIAFSHRPTFGPNARAAEITGYGKGAAQVERLNALRQFLANTGFMDAQRERMPGDASTRSYARLRHDGTAILMNSPRHPDGPAIYDGKPYSAAVHLAEDVKPFVAIDNGLRERGLNLLGLRIDHVELPLRCGQGGASLHTRSNRILVVGVSFLRFLQRDGRELLKVPITSLILPGPLNLGIGRGDSSLCLRNNSFLQMASSREVRESSLLCSHGGDRSRACGDVVAVIQLHENIASMHRLVICNGHTGDEPAHFRRDDGDIPADVRVIGALNESSNRPPVVAKCCE